MNIKELAEQATCDIKDEFGYWIGCEFDKEKFAELIAAHEREECAKICDAHGFYGVAPAREIRARSKA